MNFTILFSLFTTFLFASNVFAQDAPTLNNNTISMDLDGINFIFKSTPGTPISTTTIFFDGGSMLATEELAGLESFTLRLASEGGPDDMTKAEYQAGLDRTGTSISSAAGFDNSAISMHAIVSEFDTSWNVLVDILEHPAFRTDEFTLAIEEHLTGIRTQFDSPDSAVRITTREAFYSGHPYMIRPFGFEESVSSFEISDLHNMMNSLLVRERMTVVVVGDLDLEHVEVQIREGLRFVQSDPAFTVPQAPILSHETGQLSFFEQPDLPTNYVLGYFPMPAMDHPDYPIARIAIEILSDRLFEEVRTRRNLSYAVRAGISNRRANNGALYVTTTDPNTAIQVMYDTIDEMITNPVSQQDLDDQIEGYLTHYYMALQSATAQASMLGRWELLTGDRTQADNFINAIRQVTPEQVSQVLDQYIHNIQFGIVGDPNSFSQEIFAR